MWLKRYTGQVGVFFPLFKTKDLSRQLILKKAKLKKLKRVSVYENRMTLEKVQ